MWETFISWYINNSLGHYVENLNSAQLSLALSKGELELENVPLKKNIFRNWGLPVEVKSGVVGRIKIEFNILKYFRNEPVLITIEDVCLVAGPVNLAELDPLVEEALAHESKMSGLDGHEGRWKAQFDLQQQSNSSSYYSSLYVSSMRIGTSIVTKVVENLELNVTNVHIRFEYENEKLHRLVAFGVTLQGLTVQSCDPKWNPLSSSSTNPCSAHSSFKTLNLSKMGVYCDTKAERLSNYQLEELKIAMCKSLPNQVYILLPVSAEARVTKNNSAAPLPTCTRPRFDVDLTLERVPLQLSDSQYQYSYRMVKALRKLDRNIRLRHYRPFDKGIKGNGKEWWNYATAAVLSLRGFKRRKKCKTWAEMGNRARDNCDYVHVYQQHLTEQVLASDAQKLKDRMELELHYEDIIQLRQIAMRRIEQTYNKSSDKPRNPPPSVKGDVPIQDGGVIPPPPPAAVAANNSGILSWFFPSWGSGAGAGSPNQQMISVEERQMDSGSPHDHSSPSLIDKSRNELDLEEAILGEMRAFGRDALLARFNFTLNQGSVQLNKKKGPFLDLNFIGVAVELCLKPRSGSHSFQLRLSSIMLKDSATKSPILSPHSSAPSPYFTQALVADPLFNLVYEMKPHKKAGHRVTLSTKPMDLILYPSTWDEVGRFFSVQSEEEDNLEIPYNGYEAMKQKTKEELQVYWDRLVHSRVPEGSSIRDDERSSSWEIYMDIFAPQISIYGYRTTSRKDRNKGGGSERTGASLGQEPLSWGPAQQPRMSESKDNSFRPSRLLSHEPRTKRTREGVKEKETSQQESVVIIDLGRFKFSNLESQDPIQSPVIPASASDDKDADKEDVSDDDEEFLTPSTSPAPEEERYSYTPVSSPRRHSEHLLSPDGEGGGGGATHHKGIESFGGSLEEIHAKFYKKYSLEVTDVQVIVYHGPSSSGTWKSCNFKQGTSGLHLVDRFSINLELERRLVYSQDPFWPALTLVGTLPKLTLHLNETKILTLKSVLNAFSDNQHLLRQTRSSESFDTSFLTASQLNGRSEFKLNDTTTFVDGNNFQKSISKLFVAEFTIHGVSVDLQSRGRNIAELQIVGTKTVLTHREENTEFSFVIQSLLLADAVQTFGPDFQLLLASHPHVCMDSISGSLVDSEPTSPMSPVSPPSPMPSSILRPSSCSSGAAMLEIPLQLHDALLSSLQTKKNKKLVSSIGSQTPITNSSDALIAIDVVLANKEENMAVITVQFNNLDVIGNQESMIEILQFLHTILPNDSPQSVGDQPRNSSESSSLIPPSSTRTGSRKIQANFEFHRLNFLLLRGVVGKDGTQIARKIATTTASNARVNCNMYNSILNVEGSLGGLQVINLTPEGHRHQRVLSVGQDPLVDVTYNPFGGECAAGVSFPLQPNPNESALSFHFEKPGEDVEPKIFLRMASVIYSYCSLFLFDMKKCINQFQTPLATSLRSAATQIALGLVRQPETGSCSGYSRSPFGSLGSLDHLDFDEGWMMDGGRELGGGTSRPSCVKLDIVLDSPIIVLPKNRESPEVLVAHLGQISIAGCNNNSILNEEEDQGVSSRFGGSPPPGTTKEVVVKDGSSIGYNVFIQDVSLYSLNLKQRWKMMENFKLTNPKSNVATLMRAQDLYRCDDSSAAIPILHNTVIQFNVSYMDGETLAPLTPVPRDAFEGGGYQEEFDDNVAAASGSGGSPPRLEIQGRVISSLKVSLNPQQYSQLLDSITNVASVGEGDFLDEVNLDERRVHWEKEKIKFSKRDYSFPSTAPPPLPSPSTSSEENSTIISSCFEVPDLIVELILPAEDPRRPQYFLEEKGNPSLCLSCSDLLFKCDRKEGYVTEMSICLKALKLEDLNAQPESWKRVLAMSKNSEGLEPNFMDDGRRLSRSRLSSRRDSFSTSCPDLTKSKPMPIIPTSPTDTNLSSTSKVESSSLPEVLDPGEIFKGRYFHSKNSQVPTPSTASAKNKRRASGKPKSMQSHRNAQEFCPVTPPPSPRPERRGGGNSENLVQILITMADPKSPKFMTEFGGNHKHVDVDFNTLEILLTPDTFSSLRRFFSDAAAAATKFEVDPSGHDFSINRGSSSSSLPNDLSSGHPSHSGVGEDRNTETVIKVKSLNLKLAQSCGHLAEAEVVNVSCEVRSRGVDYFGVEGRLGSLAIHDRSHYSGLYPVKFAFQGDQALDFDYVRTGVDAKFRLNMASIVVVHTNRFYTEFMTLWNSLFGQPPPPSSDINATTLSGGNVESEHNTRVMLDIQAGAPVILLPYSSTSQTMVVADLGHLSIRNKFVTESGGLVINYITIDLIEMDLYSGELHPSNSYTDSPQGKQWNLHKGWSVMKTGEESSSFLQQQCQLNLKVGRVFEGTLGDFVAATRVQGVLSTVHCTINPEKYKLIRGLLAHNIGENIGVSEDSTTSGVYHHQSDQPNSSKTSTGRRGSGGSLGHAKIDLSIQVDLVNVTLEVVKQSGDGLGRVDFIKSKFTFQSNTDGSKDVDLASQEILVCDSRFQGKKDKDTTESLESFNIFTNILQQSIAPPVSSGSSMAATSASTSSSSSTFRGGIAPPLQAEIHYRMTGRGSNVTLVLNNMRLMVILDWWMEVRDFLGQEIPKPPPAMATNSSSVEMDAILLGGRSTTMNASPLLERSRGLWSPAVTVSTGIVTRRAPVLDVPDSTFELKINISNCDLVAVEKAWIWDTNALILKASAALGYRPHLERPISCNILQCELFSCILGLESETALSILDPTHIQIDVVPQTESESKGILDATLSIANCGKILKIQSPNLNLRLSYYDMKMFLRLMDKFSTEAQLHFLKSCSNSRDDSASRSVPANEEESLGSFEIDQLVLMGFTTEEAGQALEETHGCLEDAVFYLTNTTGRPSPTPPTPRQLHDPLLKGGRGTPVETRRNYSRDGKSLSIKSSVASLESTEKKEETEGGGNSGSIQGIEVKCNCLSLCVIDDCKDSDVPVLEISVGQLELYQNCRDNSTSADCVLSGDYYNRTLSGWEPFLEPWKCNIRWKKNLLGQLDDYSPSCEFPSRLPQYEVLLSSRSVMEISVTSTLLNLYQIVSSNWTEDYQLIKNDKRRAPFVPFALKNETGSRVWFCTIISNPEEVFRQQQKGSGSGLGADITSWIEVAQGSVQNFSFEGRGKLRHRNTHQLKKHQLGIKVEGWKEVTPVSVDRVGTYFRVAKPEPSLPRYGGGHMMELPPTRLVLEVGLQGSAQKIVTVRSALMMKNTLPDTVELKLENTIVYPSFERAQTGGSMIAQIRPGQLYPVPLHSVWAHMWIRPIIPDSYPLKYLYCTKALLIGSSSQDGQQSGEVRECVPRSDSRSPGDDLPSQPYRFCVAVKRNEFPADSDDIIPPNSLPTIVQLMSMSNRANLITLLSPFKLVNLLPHEISYEIKSLNIFGRIPPGKFDSMSNIDTSEPIEIHYQVDNFPQGVTVSINPKSNTLVQRVKLQDTQKRTLMLTSKILKLDGGVLAIHLLSPSWIVNKSGLPLLCKQDGTTGEAAGQFQEHEVGRMVTPLMMSFADQEGSEALTFRVGSGLHKDSKPYWCRSFLCQNGLRVRKLVVSHCNNSPESVYMVGVEIKNGTGRYRDTKLVIVSPRFIVDNRSTFKIQISQKAYATSFFDAKAEKTHLSLPAGCNLPFHWPRLDKEQLLCVRLKEVVIPSFWSGGFPVDNVDSFHINIRDADGNCTFLRVEIVLQGPSYFVIFSDTTQLPPPFRIDNFSMVPLVFHQACLGEERLKITARPESCLPYALDEPTQLAHVTISAPGGGTSILVNMDDLGFMGQLTYENFFYIGFTATFRADAGHTIGRSGMESLELVLDVEGVKVILSKKEQGKRSQLWRVNADGLIEHEGSSPPRDLKKPQQEGTMLVLDIAGSATVPTQCVPLMLRKPDRRRISTQHWEFTGDGRMKCKMYENLYVQAKDGFGSFGNNSKSTGGGGGSGEVGSWRLWSEVVLGPSQPVCYIRTDSGIPAEQAVARQKLRAGSGVLNLAVETDGPTRVLRIIDVEHPPRHQLLHHTFEENDYNTTPKFRMKVELPLGLGISIVACNPHREELLYGRFSGFVLEWTDTKNSQILKASVLTLQVDNQLLESEKSAVIYISSGRSDTVDDFTLYQQQPALYLYWESMKSNLNARVFKVWELVAKPISLIIEERLLLKLSMWLGFGQQVQSLDMLQQSDFEAQKALTSTASLNTRRYYFAALKIILHQVKLSVLTTSKLPADLAALKRRLGLTLIRFEDALVDLDPFEKHHPFETFEFLWALIVKHYRDELVSQAAVILGSTDFLGNPLGFVNDVSEGVSLMIYEGSVGALVKNVAHGLSNSAAKVTGTLGEGLGKTIMDNKHETERRRIKDDHSGSSGDYLYAGLKGFGHGILGGVTSVVAQSYEGASNDGITGLFTGLTKGLVGTITKPAVGVLDFATGAASAIRDSSKTSSRMMPHRLRPTRVVIGNGGLLPVYSEMSAYGQELLFDLNDRNFREIFIACETLKSGPNQDLRIMISSEAVTVFRPGKANPVILKIPLNELVECQIAPPVGDRDKTPYIELVRAVRGLPAPHRPQVVCEHEQVAKRVVQQVNYAKVLYEEMRHSQMDSINQNDE